MARDDGEDDEIVGGESPKLRLARAELEKIVGPTEKLLLWNHTVGEKPPAHALDPEPDETFTPPPRHSFWRSRRRHPSRKVLLTGALIAAAIGIHSVYRLLRSPYRPLEVPLASSAAALLDVPAVSSGGAPVQLQFAERRTAQGTNAASPSSPSGGPSALAPDNTVPPLPPTRIELLSQTAPNERASKDPSNAAEPANARRPTPAPAARSSASPPLLPDGRAIGAPASGDYELLNSEVGRP